MLPGDVDSLLDTAPADIVIRITYRNTLYTLGKQSNEPPAHRTIDGPQQQTPGALPSGRCFRVRVTVSGPGCQPLARSPWRCPGQSRGGPAGPPGPGAYYDLFIHPNHDGHLDGHWHNLNMKAAPVALDRGRPKTLRNLTATSDTSVMRAATPGPGQMPSGGATVQLKAVRLRVQRYSSWFRARSVR